jgi:hypothetical protein
MGALNGAATSPDFGVLCVDRHARSLTLKPLERLQTTPFAPTLLGEHP